MKINVNKKIVVVALTLSIFTSLPTTEAAGVKKDKFMHFGCSTVIEVALAEIPPFKKWTPLERMLFNIAVFGAGKELYDKANGGKFDWSDMTANALGAGTAEIGVRYIGNSW